MRAWLDDYEVGVLAAEEADLGALAYETVVQQAHVVPGVRLLGASPQPRRITMTVLVNAGTTLVLAPEIARLTALVSRGCTLTLSPEASGWTVPCVATEVLPGSTATVVGPHTALKAGWAKVRLDLITSPWFVDAVPPLPVMRPPGTTWPAGWYRSSSTYLRVDAGWYSCSLTAASQAATARFPSSSGTVPVRPGWLLEFSGILQVTHSGGANAGVVFGVDFYDGDANLVRSWQAISQGTALPGPRSFRAVAEVPDGIVAAAPYMYAASGSATYLYAQWRDLRWRVIGQSLTQGLVDQWGAKENTRPTCWWGDDYTRWVHDQAISYPLSWTDTGSGQTGESNFGRSATLAVPLPGASWPVGTIVAYKRTNLSGGAGGGYYPFRVRVRVVRHGGTYVAQADGVYIAPGNDASVVTAVCDRPTRLPVGGSHYQWLITATGDAVTPLTGRIDFQRLEQGMHVGRAPFLVPLGRLTGPHQYEPLTPAGETRAPLHLLVESYDGNNAITHLYAGVGPMPDPALCDQPFVYVRAGTHYGNTIPLGLSWSVGSDVTSDTAAWFEACRDVPLLAGGVSTNVDVGMLPPGPYIVVLRLKASSGSGTVTASFMGRDTTFALGSTFTEVVIGRTHLPARTSRDQYVRQQRYPGLYYVAPSRGSETATLTLAATGITARVDWLLFIPCHYGWAEVDVDSGSASTDLVFVTPDGAFVGGTTGTRPYRTYGGRLSAREGDCLVALPIGGGGAGCPSVVRAYAVPTRSLWR